MCGENVRTERVEMMNEGSPPRVRGKQTIGFGLHCPMRITPACAGKTNWTIADWSGNKDHPRVCGENDSRIFLYHGITGSPPRVRGKPNSSYLYRPPARITPACAGKTLIKVMKEGAVKDHPRVCGENHNDRISVAINIGSPPRVRGKLIFAIENTKCDRITPACAGKTIKALRFSYVIQDHPRVCGENNKRQWLY